MKKHTKMFLVTSSTKPDRFWWNSVRIIPNIFATKRCERFPRHLNSDSTLYLVRLKIVFCENSNAGKRSSTNITYLRLLLGLPKLTFRPQTWQNDFNVLAELNTYGSQCIASSPSALELNKAVDQWRHWLRTRFRDNNLNSGLIESLLFPAEF